MEKLAFIGNIEQVYKELTQAYWESEGEGLVLKRRNSIFTPALTTWLMLWQRLLPEGSIGAVVQDLQKKIGVGDLTGALEWVKDSKKVKFKKLSCNTGGLSQARDRLPLETVEAIADEMYARISEERKGRDLWQNKKVYLLDGTFLAFINTPELKEEFPPHRNNTGDCFPIARVVVAHDMKNGIAVRPEIGTKYDSEQALTIKMMSRLERDSIIMADQNFGVFSIAYHARANSLGVVLRFQKERVGRLIGHNNLEQDGECEVEWRPSKCDRGTNPDIPKEALIKGKVVVVSGTRNGFRAKRFYFFTTELDILPEELLKLYEERWFIETDLRTIKYCVDLETILVRDPDMARKEIILGVSAYNLVRTIMARGAEKIELSPRQISFTRAVGLIRATAELLVISKTNKERQEVRERFLVHLRQIKLPKRKEVRVEPRLVVRKKKSFPALRGSRQAARDKILQVLS